MYNKSVCKCITNTATDTSSNQKEMLAPLLLLYTLYVERIAILIVITKKHDQDGIEYSITPYTYAPFTTANTVIQTV